MKVEIEVGIVLVHYVAVLGIGTVRRAIGAVSDFELTLIIIIVIARTYIRSEPVGNFVG
ncbi:hypothetical protein D3C87_1665050 [compost metagenome]